MSTPLALTRVSVRFHGPGLGWLPAVWRRHSTWRTVGRFVLFGPAIGGAPYVIFILPIPFAYCIGALPALVAGLLFATWYHGGAGRVPSWPWRALVGALSGCGAAAVAAFYLVVATRRPEWFMVGVIALHGLPAAVILALVERPARPRDAAGRPASKA